VLGDLTAQEKSEVEKNLMLFPELRKELRQIEEAQETFLRQTAIEPPSFIKVKLFEEVSAAETKVVTISDNRSVFWRYAAAASISIAIVSSYLAYNYWSKWRKVSGDLTELVAQNQQIAKGYNDVNQRLNKLEQDIDIIGDSRFKRVIMSGTENAPGALASVYWNESSQEVFLRIQNMKQLSREHQYQLWAIIDGKPVDAGVFDATVTGLIKMKNVPDGAVTFAVTVERYGGNESPSLETMQMAGNVSKT
jgi:anti-sigma-K factor RskA